MKYQEFTPGAKLKPYVKSYFTFESTDIEIEDTVFPSGAMEIIFNLGDGIWKSAVNNIYYKTPAIELWGQLTRPLPIKTQGKNMMLGIRFYPHTIAYFLNEAIDRLNDQICDLTDLLGASARLLRERLLNERDLNERIACVEKFLESRLLPQGKKFDRIAFVGHITAEMKRKAFSHTVESIATEHKVTPRYLQKLFLQHTGVTPKLFNKLDRFQHSLRLVQQQELPLTSIAYECGYFDQSHFIREFKSFTGLTPSAYSPEHFPVSQAFANL